MNNDELMSRRRFFKKAAKGMLPMLGIAVLGPSFLSSCSKSDHNGCDDCAMSCSDYCGSSCEGSCDGSSTTSPSCTACSSGCQSTCTGSCSNTCTNSSNNNTNGPDNNNGVSDASGVVDGYEYVDLGLSVNWARYNYGANSPEKEGRLVSAEEIPYGYIEPVSGNEGSICGTTYDVARKKWSSKWRLPSRQEFNELISNCDYSFTTINGVIGAKFVAKNGNSIFMPAAGSDIGWGIQGAGEDGDYWTGDIKAYSRQLCDYFYFYFKGERKNIQQGATSEDKLSLRPVTKNSGTVNTCSGTCTANCANNSSSSGCSSCADSCSNGCKTSCSYNCAATCKTGCGGSCNTSCGGRCTYVSAGSGCSGCATTCYNQCYATCDLACANNCQSSCVNGSK